MWRLVSKGLVFAFAMFLLSAHAFAAETLRFAVTDIEGLENLQREYGAFKDVLSNATGTEIEFYAVSNRTAAVEALKSEKVDFVLTGPAEYVVFRKRTDAYPVVGFSRPDYFASIIVLADSSINTPKDLKGKKVAFGDVGSTSKHLAPMQVLSDHGLEPLKDVQAVHVSYKVGWESLKQGDIAALATTNDKFLDMRDKETGMEPGAFKVIARSPDLPNDVLLVGTHVDKGTVNKMRKAFETHSEELTEAVLKGEDTQKYRGMKFLTNIKDQDYDYVRAMYTTIGYPQYSKFVEVAN